jgi:tRNA-modifying protein YgfZ
MSGTTNLGPFVAPVERDVIGVRGPDAVAYLQGQLSQDVAGLAVGVSAYSLLLKPEGKIDAWLRVTRTGEDAFVVDLDAGWGDATVARLTRFKLRSRCEVEPLEAWRCLAVRGTTDVDGEACGAVVVAPARWPGCDGVDLLGPDVTAPDGLALLDEAAYHRARVGAGVPAMGAELDGSTIPAEAGRWFIDRSVSFTKGCYTGQELVARIDSRGSNTPRHLRAVRAADGAELDAGAAVVVDGAEVGRLTSAAGPVALAYVKRSVVPPAPAVVSTGSAEVPVEVAELPAGG